MSTVVAMNEEARRMEEYFIGQDSEVECVKLHEKHLSRAVAMVCSCHIQ